MTRFFAGGLAGFALAVAIILGGVHVGRLGCHSVNAQVQGDYVSLVVCAL